MNCVGLEDELVFADPRALQVPHVGWYTAKAWSANGGAFDSFGVAGCQWAASAEAATASPTALGRATLGEVQSSRPPSRGKPAPPVEPEQTTAEEKAFKASRDMIAGMDTDRLGPNKAFSALIDFMHKNEACAPLQLESCQKLLRIASQSADVRQGLVAVGAVPALVNAMHLHKDDVSLQVTAAKVLAELAVGGPECREEVAKAGGLNALAAAMQRHLTDSWLYNAAIVAKDVAMSGDVPTREYCEQFLVALEAPA